MPTAGCGMWILAGAMTPISGYGFPRPATAWGCLPPTPKALRVWRRYYSTYCLRNWPRSCGPNAKIEQMTTSLLFWGHEAAFLAYAIFAVIVGMRSARTLQALLFLLVLVATAAWAQSFVAVYRGLAPYWLERVLSALRDAAWLALGLGLMRRHAGNSSHFRSLATATAALLTLQIVLGTSDLMVGALAGVRLDVTLVRMT